MKFKISYHPLELITVRVNVEVYDADTLATLYTNAITIPAYSNNDKTHLIEGFQLKNLINMPLEVIH